MIEFAPDGKTMLTAGLDGMAKLWDLAGRRFLSALHADGYLAVRTARFSSDGKRLATGGDDKLVQVWDTGTGQRLTVLEGHASQVNAVALDTAGNRVASAGDNGALDIWDVRNDLLSFLARAAWYVKSQPFSGNTQYWTDLWKLRQGQAVAFIPAKEMPAITALTFDGPESTLVSRHRDGSVRHWNSHTLSLQRSTPGRYSEAGEVTQDGRYAVSSPDYGDTPLRVYDARTGDPLAYLDLFEYQEGGRTRVIDLVSRPFG